MGLNKKIGVKYIHEGVLWIIMLSVFFVKLFFLETRSLGGDEPFSIYFSQFSWLEVLTLPYDIGEPNPPLFMFLLHWWTSIFGVSLSAIRMLPMIFSVLTILFIYRIGYRLNGFYAALASVLIFISSSAHYYFSLEVRTYSLLILGTTMALYFFLKLYDGSKSKWTVAGLVFSNFILTYSHYFGWFIPMTEFVCMLILLKNKDLVKRVLIALSISFILYVPMWVVLVQQFLNFAHNGTYMTPPDISRYHDMLSFFLHPNWLISFSLALFILTVIFRAKDKKFIQPLYVVCLWFFIPYTVMFLVSYKLPMFGDKYIANATVPLFIAIGVFLTSFFKRRQWLSTVFIAAFMFFMLSNFNPKGISHHNYDARGATSFAKQERAMNPENTLTFIYPHWFFRGFAFNYDLDLYKDVKSIEAELASQKIFPSWGFDGLKSRVEEYQPAKIIFYQCGPGSNHAEVDRMLKYLGADYTNTQTKKDADPFLVYIFEKKSKQVDF